MNWFRRKVAAPYSYNLCPYCSDSLLLDFYWEKGHEVPVAVGRCPKCRRPFKVEERQEQEALGFNYSNLIPITTKEFNRLTQIDHAPVILVALDEDNTATQQMTPIEGDNLNLDQQPAPNYAV